MATIYQCETCQLALDSNRLRIVGWTIGSWRNVALCQECYQRGRADELYAQRERYMIVRGKGERWEVVERVSETQ